MIAFLKRLKKYGGYRDDGKNVSLGYLGCSISEDYFKFVGIDEIEVGDSVLYKEQPQGICFDKEEDITKYYEELEVRWIKFLGATDLEEAMVNLKDKPELIWDEDNPHNDGIRYCLTDERKNYILNGLKDWKEYADEEDFETVEEQLGELNKYILPKVDFETENLYFAYC